jgi:hypothetical protein
MLRHGSVAVRGASIQNDFAIPAPHGSTLRYPYSLVSNHVSGLGDLPDLPFAHSISWQALYFFVGAPQPLLGHLLQYFRLYSSDSPSLSKNWYWPHVWFSCQATLQVKQLANRQFWHIIFGCESEEHESAQSRANTSNLMDRNEPPGT